MAAVGDHTRRRRPGRCGRSVAAIDGDVEAGLVELLLDVDLALVDVPCSGTGTLGRNPEIRHRLRLEDLPRQAERQFASCIATRVSLERCPLGAAPDHGGPVRDGERVHGLINTVPEVTEFPPAR